MEGLLIGYCDRLFAHTAERIAVSGQLLSCIYTSVYRELRIYADHAPAGAEEQYT